MIAEINNKVKPAARSKVWGWIWRANHWPSKTPNKLVVIKALPAPKNTTQGLWDSAVINKVVIWVLSPISARKMVKNVEVKIAQTLIDSAAPETISGCVEESPGRRAGSIMVVSFNGCSWKLGLTGRLLDWFGEESTGSEISVTDILWNNYEIQFNLICPKMQGYSSQPTAWLNRSISGESSP